jgi:hypothetical protein
MVRIAPAQHATRPTTKIYNTFSGVKAGTQAVSQSEGRNFFLVERRFLLTPPLGRGDFVVNSEPNTGAIPSIRECLWS